MCWCYNVTLLYNRSIWLHFEGEIALRYVAENSHKCRCKDFWRGRIPAKTIYKQLQEYVVEYDAHANQYRVAEELYAPFQVGFRENKVFW